MFSSSIIGLIHELENQIYFNEHAKDFPTKKIKTTHFTIIIIIILLIQVGMTPPPNTPGLVTPAHHLLPAAKEEILEMVRTILDKCSTQISLQLLEVGKCSTTHCIINLNSSLSSSPPPPPLLLHQPQLIPFILLLSTYLASSFSFSSTSSSSSSSKVVDIVLFCLNQEELKKANFVELFPSLARSHDTHMTNK